MSNYFTAYEPVTENQALNLLENGVYNNAWIRKAESKDSKKGITYAVLTVDVYDDSGRPHSIVVWCTLSHLLRHACEATGHLEDYDNKTLILEEHLQGHEVAVNVGTQEAKDGYPARNTITDFKKKDSCVGETTTILEDDIKF